MLTIAAIILIQVPRTAPIGFELGIAGAGFQPSYARCEQIGAIQVAFWSANTRAPLEECIKKLDGWETSKRGTYVRTVQGVLQTVQLSQGTEREAGIQSDVTLIRLSEVPPAVVVPADWPDVFRRGIFRIIPDQLQLTKNLTPLRLAGGGAPAGFPGEAVYELSGTLDEVDASLKVELPRWQRRRVGTEVTYDDFQILPRRDGLRRLYSVTARSVDGRTQLTVRWLTADGDVVVMPRRLHNPPNCDDQPTSSVPNELKGNYRRAFKHDFGDGRINWDWNYTLERSFDDLAKQLESLRVEPDANEEVITVKISEAKPSSYAYISRGRTVERTDLPAGWKKTADFEGFIDYVVEDKTTWVTVRLSEQIRTGRH